jgi:hypothetical protein
MQTDKNSSFMHFSELKYKMQNGEYDFWHEFDTKEIPLPKELAMFENTFKVVYEPCGHALGIAVEADEPQYAVNVKRGVAAMMQMYTEKIEWDKKTPYAFNCKEHTLYGKGPAYYTVYPGSDHWTVKKMFEPHTSHHMFAHLSTNSKMGKCDVTYDEPLSRDSNQQYKIVEKDGSHMMEFMESNAGIYYTPFAGEGYAYHIYMNQTMHLEKIIAATPMTMKNEKFYNGLTYYTADFNTMEGIADIFHGRRTYDMDKMLVELEEMFYDTMKYVNEYHIDMKQPDWRRGQLINRMLIVMFQLDQQHLEAMHAKLMQKTSDEDKEVLHVYYHMLPMIGSHASYMFMSKLIKTKKVKDTLAMEWLQNMPFHVKEPNKMLLDHMSEMLNWGDEISMDVRKAAILCFGTFMEKAIFRHNKLNHINNWTGHGHHDNVDNFTPDYDLDGVFPGAKYYEKYLTMMGEKMKAAEDIGMRATYISALFNTKMEKAYHYLWPIARGEMWNDNYLRMLAIVSMGPLVARNEELIYEVFWPIMSNYHLNTNLRVAAYSQIMQSHPSQQRLINLYWQMQDELNPVFYQFHYSYLLTVSHTTDPCFDNFRTSVKQILRYTEVPERHGLTGFYEVDFMDTKYEFGHQWGMGFVNAPWESETTLKFFVADTYDNAKFPLFSMMLRVDGMDASIFDDVALYMKDNTKLFNFEKVWKAYNEIMNNKNIRIDIGQLKDGQVIMSYNYDASNIKDLMTKWEYFFGTKYSYIKKYLAITYPKQTNVIVPTDMGFPGLFKIYIPKAFYFDFKVTKEIVNNLITFQYDSHIKVWSHGRVGLSVYNPFVDMYQGVQRMSTFDGDYPIFFDLTINPAQQTMKLTWKRHEDPIKDTCAVKMHAATFTFFRDDMKMKMLQESSPESKNWAMVRLPGEHEDHKILYENDNSNTGMHQIVAQYDSDAYASNMTIFKHYNYLHSAQHYHSWLGHWFLTKMHALIHSFIQPYPYANGLLMRTEPSKEYPVTNVDMTLRFTKDYKRGEMSLYPAAKYNLRGTYTVKNKETTTKTWDANMILDSDLGQTTTTMKAIFSRIIPGQKEFRVCMDATRKFVSNSIEAEATIGMSHSTEPKCTKDEEVMAIKIKAEKLPEQLDNKHMYGECYDHVWSDIHEANRMACYYARDSLRLWTYDIHTKNMPTEFKNYIKRWFDNMKINFMPYFTKYGEATMTLEKDHWVTVHEYPMIGDKGNMHVYTHDNDYKFGGIPASKHPYYKFHMMATKHFSPLFRFMHAMGWTKMCTIHENVVTDADYKDVKFEMPADWTMYYGEAETDAKHGLWMKKLSEHNVAMKMMHGEHSLEIVPTGHKEYDVLVDGKKLPAHTYQHEEEWFWMDWVKDTGVISVVCMHTGGHLLYDGHHVFAERPNVDMTTYGICGSKF